MDEKIKKELKSIYVWLIAIWIVIFVNLIISLKILYLK